MAGSLQEGAKASGRVLPKKLVLAVHQRRPDHFRGARGEMVVPEEGHLFLERAARGQQPDHPPELHGGHIDLAVLVGELLQGEIEILLHLLIVEQLLNGAGKAASLKVEVQFGFAGSQTEAPQQMRALFSLRAKCHELIDAG
jgi:hypothetical protein